MGFFSLPYQFYVYVCPKYTSMKFHPRYSGLIALILVMVILIVGRYGELLQWSTYKVIEPYGDGFKNYTCIQYHAQHDTTFTFYEGMNYPYREHSNSASTQPLTSNSLKVLSQIFGDLTPYTIPVVNHSMLLSILLTGVFLFLIFKELELPDWYAIVAGVGITFLSPQTHRMVSHYGLTHPEVIPAVIYFLLKFSKSYSIKWSVAIAIVIFLYSLIHFYYFPIVVFPVSFFFLFAFLKEISWKQLWTFALHYGIQVGLPLLFFFSWLILLDPVEDRTSHPWGYMAYKAEIQGLFTSLTQPHFQWIDQQLITFKRLDFEAQNYFGLFASIFFFLLLAHYVSKKLGRSSFVQEMPHQKALNHLFASSFVVLLLALGFPFIIPRLEPLLDYSGPLKQFRSSGRFAWPMYYVINIMAFAYLFKWAQPSPSWLRRSLPILCLVVLLFEAYHFSYARDYGLDEISTMKPGEKYTDTSIDFSKYQAILPIPFYNMGSGNFWWPYAYSFSLQQSQVLSVQTGLPVVASLVNRSSPIQAVNQMQLVLEPYRPPVVLEDYPNEKPLLLLWDHYQKERPEYKDEYPHFENAGITLYDEGYIRLAELSLESFEQRIQARKDRIQHEINTDSLFQNGDFLSSQNAKDFLYASFDEETSEQPYLGSGGLSFAMPKKQQLFEGVLPEGRSAHTYEVLFWMYIKKDLIPRSMVSLEEKDPQGNTVQNISTMAWQLVKAIDDQGWALHRLTFELEDPANRLSLSLDNQHLRNQTFYVDELLIKPIELDLYRENERYIWKNNRYFPKD